MGCNILACPVAKNIKVLSPINVVMDVINMGLNLRLDSLGMSDMNFAFFKNDSIIIASFITTPASPTSPIKDGIDIFIPNNKCPTNPPKNDRGIIDKRFATGVKA